MRLELRALITSSLMVCAAPVIAQQMHPKPAPPPAPPPAAASMTAPSPAADNRPGSPSTQPSSMQRQSTMPPSQTQPPAPRAGSIPETGPKRDFAGRVEALELSIANRQVELGALLNDQNYRSKITALEKELQRRYDAAREPLDREIWRLEQASSKAWDAYWNRPVGQEPNPAYMAEYKKLEASINELKTRIERINRDREKGREIIKAREAQMREQYERDLEKVNAAIQKDTEAIAAVKKEQENALALQESKRKTELIEAQAAAMRIRMEIEKMRAKEKALDAKVDELRAAESRAWSTYHATLKTWQEKKAAGATAEELQAMESKLRTDYETANSDRRRDAAQEEAHDVATERYQLERALEGKNPPGSTVTTENLLLYSVHEVMNPDR